MVAFQDVVHRSHIQSPVARSEVNSGKSDWRPIDIAELALTAGPRYLCRFPKYISIFGQSDIISPLSDYCSLSLEALADVSRVQTARYRSTLITQGHDAHFIAVTSVDYENCYCPAL